MEILDEVQILSVNLLPVVPVNLLPVVLVVALT